MTTSGSLLLSTFTRNAKWSQVQKKFLKLNGECAVCGARKRLEAHHIRPHHVFPELELDVDNLITLCSAHHLSFGHLMSYKSYNVNVVEDAKIWRAKIAARPKWRQLL
jgi:5-methylcytosine-specific restriction endonuclease McrA